MLQPCYDGMFNTYKMQIDFYTQQYQLLRSQWESVGCHKFDLVQNHIPTWNCGVAHYCIQLEFVPFSAKVFVPIITHQQFYLKII